MKKIAVTVEKIIHVYKAFDRKNINSHADNEDFPSTAFERTTGSTDRKTQNKILS